MPQRAYPLFVFSSCIVVDQLLVWVKLVFSHLIRDVCEGFSHHRNYIFVNDVVEFGQYQNTNHRQFFKNSSGDGSSDGYQSSSIDAIICLQQLVQD